MSQQNINNSQLSRETGVSIDAIRNYALNRFSRIDNENAAKLCNYFGVSMGDMFALKEEEGKQ